MLSQPLVYLIAMLFIFFFFGTVNFLQYLFNRDKAFMYYALYLFAMLAYLLVRTGCFAQSTVGELGYICQLEAKCVNPINLLVLWLYYLFALSFIEYDRYDKKLFKVVRFLTYSIAIGFFIDVSLLIFNFHDLEKDFFLGLSWYITFLSLWCIIKTYMIKNRVVLYIVIGSTFFYIGSVISLYFDTINQERQSSNVWTLAVTYEYLGSLLEAVCFSVGLSYRTLMIQVEKNKLQTQIIEDLREKEALQASLYAERDRIATEMHDDLGAGLSTLKLLGERAKKSITDDKALYTIYKMTHLSNDLIERLVTIIWAMNSQNDTIEGLTSYFHGYAFEYLEETHDIKCYFPLPDLQEDIKKITINGERRRRLFLFFKESLHNIFKHAQARQVNINVTSNNTHWEMAIEDDGIGLSEKNQHKGNGLQNMEKHCTALGGKFTIKRSEKGGVLIHLLVPIGVRN
jgi:signal transduction histidine kinase